jgi:Macrocin-O-methyltransferase (TylF)
LKTQNKSTEYARLGTVLSPEEMAAARQLAAKLKDSPVPDREVIAHLGAYLDKSALGHILFIHELYTRILNVHGVIIEMGVRWGRNLALFTELRNLYEPRNPTRRIIGLDTFAGFPGVTPQDGAAEGMVAGAYSVKPGYEAELASLLSTHEQFGLRSHQQKFELLKGDISDTLPEYLARHPETIVALAYFDLDLYEGTRQGLELIKDRLVKGSVVAFDELCAPEMPGETHALLDTWGLRDLRIQRSPMSHFESFMVVE